MASCRCARDRESLRFPLWKLFSRGLSFIGDFVSLKRYRAAGRLTTKRLWDLWVPLLREDVRVAQRTER
jgi:hypothetical protein